MSHWKLAPWIYIPHPPHFPKFPPYHQPSVHRNVASDNLLQHQALWSGLTLARGDGGTRQRWPQNTSCHFFTTTLIPTSIGVAMLGISIFRDRPILCHCLDLTRLVLRNRKSDHVADESAPFILLIWRIQLSAELNAFIMPKGPVERMTLLCCLEASGSITHCRGSYPRTDSAIFVLFL